jgi:hypothetical protein
MPHAWRIAGPPDEDAVASLMLAFYEESGADWDRAAARQALPTSSAARSSAASCLPTVATWR